MEWNSISNEEITRLTNAVNNSQVFLINDKTGKEFEKARKTLIENICTLTLNQRKLTPEQFDLYGELVDAVDHCLKSFDSSKGEFIHFFNSTFSWYSKISADKELREKNRIVNSGYDTYSGCDFSDEDNLDYMVYHMNSQTKFDSEFYEENPLSDYGVKLCLDAMKSVYKKLQERTRKFFQIYATEIVYSALTEELFEKFDVRNLPFFDDECFSCAVKRNKVHSQHEIAVMFGKNEANISRMFGSFKTAIAEELKYDFSV